MPAKRCIVLGGSGRLGGVICRQLAAKGARVAFTFHQGEAAATATSKAMREPGPSRQVDLTDTEALSESLVALAGELGGVDALIHAAAVGSTAEPAVFDEPSSVTPEGWRRLFAVNVESAFFACQALASHFPEAGGNVVLIGSVDGVKPVPSPVPYAASKAALSGMVLSLAKAFGPKRIRVNLIAPGVLEHGASRTLPDELREQYIKHCALRRLGTLDEAASVVSWFGLDNTYVTGQTVLVDGGL